MGLPVAWCCSVVVAAAAVLGSVLGEHLSPDDQLAHPLLRGQGQQTVVLAVQTHIQQVLLRQVVGYQVALVWGEGSNVEGIFK